MRLAILLIALLQRSQPLQTRPSLRRPTRSQPLQTRPSLRRPTRSQPLHTRPSPRLHAREDAYANYWDELLLKEYREAAAELRSRRQTWSRKRLEDSGDSVFGTATPESELFGDKIVRVTRYVRHVPVPSLAASSRTQSASGPRAIAPTVTPGSSSLAWQWCEETPSGCRRGGVTSSSPRHSPSPRQGLR